VTEVSSDAKTDIADGSDRSGLEGTGDSKPTPDVTAPNVDGDT